jgi:hypothetical protein
MLFACLCCSYMTLAMICCMFTMLTYYGGCGCFVSDKVVCTAVIRVFGRQLAEVPLVATSLEHQGQVSCLDSLISPAGCKPSFMCLVQEPCSCMTTI